MAMAETDAEKVLVFVADGRAYGCPLDAIREIVPFHAATRLAGAPDYVVGLINLRGRLVTVVDLAAQLGSRAAGTTRAAGGSIILLEVASRMVGVLVEEVRDVRPLSAEAVEPIQRDEGGSGMMLRSLARLSDGVVVVLDPDAIVAHVLQ